MNEIKALPSRPYSQPNSPSSTARLRFEKNVRRYFYQLSVGCCGCLHKLCHGNPSGPKLTTDAAMIMAVQLAQRPIPMFCPNIPLEPPLTTPSESENSNSKPFLSSLLSSSPFATLFNPIQNSEDSFIKRSVTSDNLHQNSSEKLLDVAISNEPSTSDSISSLGLRMFNSLKFKTKSFMDLPSLWSSPNDLLISSSSTNTLQYSSLTNSPDLRRKHINEPSSLNNSTASEQLHIQQFSPNNSINGHQLAQFSPDNSQNLSLKYLTLPSLKLAANAYTKSLESKYEGEKDLFFINTLRTTFSSSGALNNSFLIEGESDAKFNPSGIDILAVRESYNVILEIANNSNEIVLSTFVNALEILLAKLELNLKRLQNGEKLVLRQLIVLLENPLLHERSYHETLLKKLCMIVGGLRTKSTAIIKSCYDYEGLSKIVAVFKNYVDDHHYGGPKPDEALIGAVKVLSMLYHANESSKPKILPLSHFYNEALSKKLNFKDEYKIWKRTQLGSNKQSSNKPPQQHPRSHSLTSVTKQNGQEFSYFNFPFLFDPVAKTRILHIDAMTQMSLGFEDAFVHQALVIHAQRFLHNPESVASFEQGMEKKTNPYLVLEVRRGYLVEDVLDQLLKKKTDLKKPLKVKFVGEEGSDLGGVQKEFFQTIIGKLMDPSYGMFNYDEETRFVWINGASLESERQFELIGIVIGLALYNGVILGIGFPRVLYKKLLDEEIDLIDLSQGFPALGKGLSQLLEWDDGDVSDIFMRNFEISYDVYGHVKTFPLVSGGSDIPVTNENRREFVKLYINHFISESTKRQFSAFKRGFQQVCSGPALKLCRAEELELMICGTNSTDLDFKLLEDGTLYDDYTPDHPIIKSFWKIVHEEFSLEMRKKMLSFVTSSDRVPLKGLGDVTFVIQRNGSDSDRLPTAQTCFGRLLLPEYSGIDKLRDRLVIAIENGVGFGFM